MQVLITGASGRLGQILRTAWKTNGTLGFEPLWSCRKSGVKDSLDWDILMGAAPVIGKGTVILHLAGVLQGDKSALSANSEMAINVCMAAKAAGSAQVFLASSAAVYGESSRPHCEVHAPAPRSEYGRAKLQMERDALSWAQHSVGCIPQITCLRIANVLGADALFNEARSGKRVVLDNVPGQLGGPLRSYIGPNLFATVMATLIGSIARGERLPSVLNIAAPGPVRMADLLNAAQIQFRLGTVDAEVIPKVSLSTKRLAAFLPVPEADASSLVADWRIHMAAAA